MTRLPTESRNVLGLSGPEYPRYKVGPVCSVPGCSRYADHAHHIWRRSALGGDHAWVKLLDTDTIVGNLTALCWQHHEDVTLNRSRIMWSQREKKFYWCDVRTDNIAQISAAIFPQPPIHGEPVSEPESANGHPVGPAHVMRCPSCQQVIREKREPSTFEAKKRRKTWVVKVPDETLEDGGLVLDTLLRECADLFGHDTKENLRYYTLVQALALVVQNQTMMLPVSDGSP